MKWEDVLHGNLNANTLDILKKKCKAKRVEVFVTEDDELAFVQDNRSELEDVETLVRRVVKEYISSISTTTPAPAAIEVIDKSGELEEKINEFIRKLKCIEERIDKLERQKTDNDIEDIKKQLGWA